MKTSLATMLLLLCSYGCSSPDNRLSQPTTVISDDRSFFVMPDKNDFPGDELSHRQTLAAIAHYADGDICQMQRPWRWALIGPNTFLLAGTRYIIRRRLTADYPNIGLSKGFWGGEVFDSDVTVRAVKLIAQERASGDCQSGVTP